MTFLRWLTFLLGFQTVILTVLLFWIYFFPLTLVFVLQWLSLHWEILVIFLSQFSLSFHHIHNGMPHFVAYLMTILVLIEMVFVITWEMFHGRILLNSVLLLLLVKFCECVQVEIHVYISHQKYQVKSHSSPWFSAACAAPIVYKNHFFCLYQKDKSAQSKTKFRQTSNGYKSVLETAKLAYANKAKKSISSQKFGLRDFFTYFIHNLFIVGKYK